ncbi:MAG: type II secretion system protein [Patescibacteria group bacterium]
MRFKFNKKGFTLIEMVIAVAVLAIVSAAILVSISGQKEKAEATEMLTEMSATIQPIMMCLSDGGNVNSPSGGDRICDISSNYGQWPNPSDSFGSYNSSSFSGGDWYFYVDSGSDGYRICCNSNMTGCERLDGSDPCSANNP